MLSRRVIASCLGLSFPVAASITPLPEYTAKYDTLVPTSISNNNFTQYVVDAYISALPGDTLAKIIDNGQNELGLKFRPSGNSQNIDLKNINGFILAGQTSTNTNGQYSINESANGHVQNISHYGKFLYLIRADAVITRWETTGNGTVSGAGRALWIADGATVGNVVNSTTTRSDSVAFTNNGTITGTMTNTGAISGTESALDIEDNGSLFALDNKGTLSGRYAVRNFGNIGSIVNAGTMTGGILNAGAISNDVTLNGASLILAGNTASLGGRVTGTAGDGSTVAVGDTANNAVFRATNSVTVDNVVVNTGSILSVSSQANWKTSNGITNNGLLILESGSSLNGVLFNDGTIQISTEKNATATLTGNLSSSGRIVLNPTTISAGNTLIINGNYNGLSGSVVTLGSVLANDSSSTDRLVITGNTSGASTLLVANENGVGGATREGINLIGIGGASNATFTLGNRVVAGAYDYRLRKGNVSGTDHTGWYLTSFSKNPNPNPNPNPVSMYRPEAGAYAANLLAANTLFNFSLHDRSSETSYFDAATGETHKTSLWMRNLGGHSRYIMHDGQNQTQMNRYVLQLGGDLIQATSNDTNAFYAGIMGGYARASNSTHNNLTNHDAKGNLDGYSTGFYGTWYQDAEGKAGAWADMWAQYNWFNNEVSGDMLATEHYKSRGLKASFESGYAFLAGRWSNDNAMESRLYIEPHIQGVWSDITADNHTESEGTQVQGTGNDNLMTRFGVRAYLNTEIQANRGTVIEFKPFIEVNWLHSTKHYGVKMNDHSDIIHGTDNAAELKTGIEGRLSKHLSVSLIFLQQTGGNSWRDSSGALQVNYQF
ncbi:autotransporter outer membrane beta-barrel domain-containing protein (plasmid) [Pantoea sp. OXWO6B1]|nr:autotransporter outer membrane beta-barrel domain-containing protein [Pantoea sp. OXWO6B1]